jgi:signal transduction histidine kinase/CheY-like chemotaxis protein
MQQLAARPIPACAHELTRFVRLLFLLAFALGAGLASRTLAAPVVALQAGQSEAIALHKHLEFLQDADNTLTFEAVSKGPLAQQFQANTMPQFMRAGHPLTYWFRIRVRNNSEQQLWYLYLASSRYSELDFYAPDANGVYQHVRTGNAHPFSSRPVSHQHFAFPFTLAQGQSTDIYLRARIQAEGLLWMPASLATPEQLQTLLGRHDGLFRSFYAIMACMLLYNLCLYLRLRLNALLFYCITVAADIGVLWSLDGMNFRYLWPDMPDWERLSLAVIYLVALVTHLIFVYDILEISRRLRSLIWPFRILIGINLAGFPVLALFPKHEVALAIIQLNGISTMLVILFAVGLGIMRNVPSAKYFLASEIFFCAGTITRLGITLGLMPITAWTYYSFHIGYLFEIVLLSLALADRFRLIQQEKEELQKLALHESESSNMLKDQFLATISHEMRTPMAGVDAALHLLKDQNLPPKYDRLVDAALQSTSEMIVLVDKILDFAEVQSGAMVTSQTTVNLHALLEALASRYRTLCNIKKLQFHLDIDGDVPQHVIIDAAKLQAILNILLDNAVKYTPRGSVWLIVKPDASATGDALNVRFIVRDSGIGIPEEHQHRIFEHFQQADSSFAREHGGLGIGLSMCKQLTGLLKGSISFYSVPGDGSEFEVRLPLTEASTDSPDASSADSAQPMPREGALEAHALVVEDNPVNKMVLAAVLEKFGLTVSSAGNGQDALAFLRENHVDIVFMDCQMPVMDGFETTRLLRNFPGRNRDVPVIAVTANAMGRDIERCIEAGMDDHVKKPIDRQLLHAKILRLLSRRSRDGALQGSRSRKQPCPLTDLLLISIWPQRPSLALCSAAMRAANSRPRCVLPVLKSSGAPAWRECSIMCCGNPAPSSVTSMHSQPASAYAAMSMRVRV